MSERNFDIDRRSFLKNTAATAAVGSMTFAGTAGANGSRVYTVTGSKNDPVTGDQIAEANQAAVDDFADRNGEVVEFADALPGDFEGTVVDYVTVVDSNGEIRRYGGIVGEKAGEQRIHSRAQKRAREFAQEADTKTVSTQTSWDLYLHDEWDYDDCPYGVITNNIDLYELTDDGDSYEDAWTMDQYQVMDPGIRSCSDSSWRGHKMHPHHRWDNNEIGSIDLDEWDPNTDLSGSQEVDVSLSTGGASIGWKFTIPDVEFKDDSSPIDNYTDWKVKLNASDLEDELITIEPGSSAWSNENPDGKLMEAHAECEFKKYTWCCTDYHTHDVYWNVYV